MAELLRGIPVDYEPKRKNRFVLEFPTELGIEVWKVQTVTRPKLEINPVEVHWINTVNFVAGKGKWSPIDIEFIDTQGPSTSTETMEWIRLCFESLTGRMGYAAGYKKTLILKALDPTGVEVEKWELRECMPTNIEFGENSQEDDGLQTVKLTVQPFMCILNY
jgi:hypothetical protein